MNPSKRTLSALVLGLVLLLPGCLMSRETSNTPLDREVLAALQPGVSTGEDVARILGAPNEVVQLGRRSAWRYEFVQAKRSGLFLLVVAFQNLDSRQDRVWVFFDEEDVLTHYGSTFEADDSEWGMPWQDLESDEHHDQDGAGEAGGE
jgi:hypothetical protein